MTNPYSPLKVYLAAPFEERPVVIHIKECLEARGVIVTSTWLTDADTASMDALKSNPDSLFANARMRALKDYEDIDEADVVVLYKPKAIHKRPTSGGHHDEVGYAHGTGKPVVIYGERENVFHYHPLVSTVGSLDELCRALHVPVDVPAADGVGF